jgi:hypothetical protein
LKIRPSGVVVFVPFEVFVVFRVTSSVCRFKGATRVKA